MFTLAYDPGMWDDESIYEEFNTVDELLERYEEIQYDFCEFRAYDENDKKFAPWFQKKA